MAFSVSSNPCSRQKLDEPSVHAGYDCNAFIGMFVGQKNARKPFRPQSAGCVRVFRLSSVYMLIYRDLFLSDYSHAVADGEYDFPNRRVGCDEAVEGKDAGGLSVVRLGDNFAIPQRVVGDYVSA